MKVDLYTKICLTVIALSLSIIAIKDFLPVNKAIAQSYFQGQLQVYNQQNDLQLNEVVGKLWDIESVLKERL